MLFLRVELCYKTPSGKQIYEETIFTYATNCILFSYLTGVTTGFWLKDTHYKDSFVVQCLNAGVYDHSLIQAGHKLKLIPALSKSSFSSAEVQLKLHSVTLYVNR